MNKINCNSSENTWDEAYLQKFAYLKKLAYLKKQLISK